MTKQSHGTTRAWQFVSSNSSPLKVEILTSNPHQESLRTTRACTTPKPKLVLLVSCVTLCVWLQQMSLTQSHEQCGTAQHRAAAALGRGAGRSSLW